MVSIPASVFRAMQEALQQQQQQQQQAATATTNGGGSASSGSDRDERRDGRGDRAHARRRSPSPPRRPSHRAPNPPQPSRAAVEAEMMGLPAAAHPHIAALVASLMRHGLADARPHPRNPVALLYEAAHALAVRLDLRCDQLNSHSFEVRVCAAPGRDAGGRGRRRLPDGVPPLGSEAAAALFDRGGAGGGGASKRDARNAAAAGALERMLRDNPRLAEFVWRGAVQRFPMRPDEWAGGGDAAAAVAGGDRADDLLQRQHQKAQRIEEHDLERRLRDEARRDERRREEQEWEARAAGRPHEQLQRAAQHRRRGVSPPPPRAPSGAAEAAAAVEATASAIAQLHALQRHMAALAENARGQAPPTALQLLNQYGPAAMLEIEYLEAVKELGGRGGSSLAIVSFLHDVFVAPLPLSVWRPI